MIAQPIWNADSASPVMPDSVLIHAGRHMTIRGGRVDCPADGDLQRSLGLSGGQEF